MKRYWIMIVFGIASCYLAVCTAGVSAQPAASAAADPIVEPSAGDAVSRAVDALRDGQWVVALGAGLWLLVYLVRSDRVRRVIPAFGTRIGGYALAIGLPAVTTIAAGLYSGAGLSIDLIVSAIGAGFLAIGLHATKKDVGSPRSNVAGQP